MRCPNGTRKNPKTQICEKKKTPVKKSPKKKTIVKKSLSKPKTPVKKSLSKPKSPKKKITIKKEKKHPTQEPVCEFSLKTMWLKELESFDKKDPVKSEWIDKLYSKLSLKVHPDALTECHFEEPNAFIIELTQQKDALKTKMDALTARRRNILNFRKFIEKLHC
jgi:hypothetical protein